MDSGRGWAMFAGAVLLAVVVGLMAYNAGIAHGVAQSGKIVVAAPPPVAPSVAPVPYYPYYGWHPWGFGFFFAPFLFFIFFAMIVRSMIWGARGYRHGYCGGRLSEWHRQEHAQMQGEGQPRT